MAVTYGFYNSVSGDRKYDARQIASIFDGVILDGVYQSIGTALIVTASSGLQVRVATAYKGAADRHRSTGCRRLPAGTKRFGRTWDQQRGSQVAGLACDDSQSNFASLRRVIAFFAIQTTALLYDPPVVPFLVAAVPAGSRVVPGRCVVAAGV